MKHRLLDPTKGSPLLVEPSSEREAADPVELVEAQRPWLDDRLHEHGAVLFRGFHVDDAEAFQRVARAAGGPLNRYIEGNSPRQEVTGDVYTSTEYPPKYSITLHNELSYAHWWPEKLFFYCERAPERGGETPIADCRRFLELIAPDLRERFVAKRVRYLQCLHGGRGFGKSWQQAFETSSKEDVERYLEKGGVDFEWGSDGGLRTRQVRDAVAVHPVTGEEVWFNQADQWHPSSLEPSVRSAMLKVLKEENMPHNACYGDGDPFTDEELDTVRNLFWGSAVVFPWQTRDVLVVDNMLMAHGRKPYEGDRRILVAMS